MPLLIKVIRLNLLSFLTLLPLVAAHALDVRGNVEGNWRQDDSPVNVLDDIEVVWGSRLTIESGVEVRINQACRIVIEGSIVAVGTAEAPIVFTTSREDAFWGGMRLLQTDALNRLVFCRFEFSQQTADYPQVDSRGGALYADRANIEILDCNFNHNRATGQGGAVCLYNCDGEFTRNTVIDNYGFTEIVWLQDSEMPVRGNIFESNSGDYGAGLILESCSPPVESNLFRHNSSTRMIWGGSLYFVHGSTSPTRNNVVVDNQGGGVFIGYDANLPVFEQNTIANNQGHSGLFLVNGGRVNIVNSIIWGHNADISRSGGNGVARFSDIHTLGGVEAGEGMLDVDPEFQDAENGDYRLSINSPCRNAGDPESARDPDGTRADIGCFFSHLPVVFEIEPDTLRSQPVGAGVETRIEFTLTYIEGELTPILIVILPREGDDWLEVTPTEGSMEPGDVIDGQARIRVPDEAEPGRLVGEIQIHAEEDPIPFMIIPVIVTIAEEFGSASGVIIDHETDEPVANVDITMVKPGLDRLLTSSNPNGQFEFPILPAGRYLLETSHPRFLSFRQDSIQILRDHNTELVVELLYSECEPSTDSIAVSQIQDTTLVGGLRITNPGTGPLQYQLEITAPGGRPLERVVSLVSIDLDAITRNARVAGIGYAENNFYVSGITGFNEGVVFSINRDNMRCTQLPNAVDLNSDMAFDGRRMWGTVGRRCFGYSLDWRTALDPWWPNRMPLDSCVGVAYDMEREMIWINNGRQTTYAFNHEGAIRDRADIRGVNATGIAWCEDDPEQARLYLLTTSQDNRAQLYKFDNRTNELFFVTDLPFECEGTGGLEYVPDFSNGEGAFTAVMKGRPNTLRVFQLDERADQVRVTPTNGMLDADSTQWLELTFSSFGASDSDTVDTELHIYHNGRGATAVIPIRMLVFRPNEVNSNTDPAPAQFELFTPSPNPFNGVTQIRFSLTRSAVTRLEAFDLGGRCVGILLEGQMTAGTHSVSWDAEELSTGIYFLRLESGDQVGVMRAVLMR